MQQIIRNDLTKAAALPLVREVSSSLRKLYGERLSKIILYGSYARGEQTPDSDIDLLIVLKDPQVDAGKEIHFINESIFPIALENNTSISAHPFSLKRFETEKSFFLNRVRKEGKVL